MILILINKKSLSEQVYESLKADIIAQKIQFGATIVNRQIQEKYEISSTPVRDAINRLFQDGLIERISRTGAKVINFEPQFALEINEIVSMLCVSAVKLSAKERINPNAVAALDKALDLQKQFIDSEHYFEYDYDFHHTFFIYSNNSRLKELYKQYNTLREMLVLYYHEKGKNKDNAIREHETILDAYKKNDIQTAQNTMEKHFATASIVLSGISKP